MLYTLRGECERDLEGTLRSVARLGYGGVEALAATRSRTDASAGVARRRSALSQSDSTRASIRLRNRAAAPGGRAAWCSARTALRSASSSRHPPPLPRIAEVAHPQRPESACGSAFTTTPPSSSRSPVAPPSSMLYASCLRSCFGSSSTISAGSGMPVSIQSRAREDGRSLPPRAPEGLPQPHQKAAMTCRSATEQSATKACAARGRRGRSRVGCWSRRTKSKATR